MNFLPISSSVFLVIWHEIAGSGAGSETGVPGRGKDTSKGVEAGVWEGAVKTDTDRLTGGNEV